MIWIFIVVYSSYRSFPKHVVAHVLNECRSHSQYGTVKVMSILGNPGAARREDEIFGQKFTTRTGDFRPNPVVPTSCPWVSQDKLCHELCSFYKRPFIHTCTFSIFVKVIHENWEENAKAKHKPNCSRPRHHCRETDERGPRAVLGAGKFRTAEMYHVVYFQCPLWMWQYWLEREFSAAKYKHMKHANPELLLNKRLYISTRHAFNIFYNTPYRKHLYRDINRRVT